MKMSLLHALAAILTVLVLVVRQRHALAAVCSKNFKYRNLFQYEKEYFENDFCYKEPKTALSEKITNCTRNTLFTKNPKCKKDPEINVDNEEIGQYPYED